MKRKGLVVVLVTALMVGGWAPSLSRSSGPLAAHAQDAKAAESKGVTAKNLVTSLGPFRGVADVPIVLTGQIVEIAPGGQTGRERYLVPSYLYVLEGTLTTNNEGGPIGVNGVQYHTAGQSFMDPVGVWHNHSNTGQAPLKYLLLLIGTPGGPTTQKPSADD